MGRWKAFGGGAWNLLIALDQIGNVLIGMTVGAIRGSSVYGDPDETISSVLGRKATAGNQNIVERALTASLDWIDPLHVFEAIESPRDKNKIIKIPRPPKDE